jgi:hypothetical protein
MTAHPPVRLYTYAMSPFAAKVHCFLLYKRIPFECFYVHPLRVRQDLPVGHQIPVVTVDTESRADSTPSACGWTSSFPKRRLSCRGIRMSASSCATWMTGSRTASSRGASAPIRGRGSTATGTAGSSPT